MVGPLGSLRTQGSSERCEAPEECPSCVHWHRETLWSSPAVCFSHMVHAPGRSSPDSERGPGTCGEGDESSQVSPGAISGILSMQLFWITTIGRAKQVPALSPYSGLSGCLSSMRKGGQGGAGRQPPAPSEGDAEGRRQPGQDGGRRSGRAEQRSVERAFC